MLRFQQDGIVFVVQHVSSNLWRMVLNMGHLFNAMTEIWSKGQGHALALHLLIAFVISLYDGASNEHGILGFTSFGIQSGIMNKLEFLTWCKESLKYE
jgi:hypothetical protein